MAASPSAEDPMAKRITNPKADGQLRFGFDWYARTEPVGPEELAGE